MLAYVHIHTSLGKVYPWQFGVRIKFHHLTVSCAYAG